MNRLPAPRNRTSDQNEAEEHKGGPSSHSNASIHESQEYGLDEDSDSFDNFANQADDEFDSSDDDGEKRLGR